MGRNVLLITTDQQRFDALGCNGGTIARTPALDGLARDGIRYSRAYAQNTVCMPTRSTILTGQYPRTHGVIANGIPLPADAPSIAADLAGHGYRTALIGKAHFEPIWDPDDRWEENRLAPAGSTGPYRGFDHVEFAGHGPTGANHYAQWFMANHRERVRGFAPIFSVRPSGETDAPEISYNPVPREMYHTDWIAERTMAWLDGVDADDDFFCWMSFPDPHHPWDPPASERHRVDWRDLDLPAGHPGDADAVRRVLEAKPEHWLAWWEGRTPNVDAAPPAFVPARLTDDQLREINALVHIENELIDEACGRVLAHLRARGLDDDTDVIFTTDHGEFQGDLGLLYKGPYHVDALLRLPMIWRPAPSTQVARGATVDDPVGQIDLAPTLCEIAGIDVPDHMQGAALPLGPGSGHERALAEWDSQLDNGYRLRTIVRDGWLCTVYEASDFGSGMPVEHIQTLYGVDTPFERITYDGTEGELYRLDEDPHQWHNLWDDPARRSVRDDLVADLRASLPAAREPRLAVESMA